MRYNPDHRGIARLLKDDQMGEAMEAAARGGAEYAQSISPVDTGEYAGSFETSHEVDGDRQVGVLANTAGHADQVEWEEGYHVLSRTADHIEAGG